MMKREPSNSDIWFQAVLLPVCGETVKHGQIVSEIYSKVSLRTS